MISILLGGLTHPYINSHLNYCNTVNSYGSIQNNYVVAIAGDRGKKLGFILGKDSACGNIFGPVSSFNISGNLDFVLGGYNTNFKEFDKLRIKPSSIFGITPIVGLNYKVDLYRHNNFEVKLDNIVSLGIITHAVSFNF